jgi:hypothetical protein
MPGNTYEIVFHGMLISGDVDSPIVTATPLFTYPLYENQNGS